MQSKIMNIFFFFQLAQRTTFKSNKANGMSSNMHRSNLLF